MAGPPPMHERRRLRAAVGIVEIEDKAAESARKHAYYKALLGAENAHLHNEPVDVNDTKGRPDWLEWKRAMQEELDSLE